MKLFIITAIVFTASLAHAQMGGQQPPSPDVTQMMNQISDVGCRAERQVSATTIVQLQKENADLKKQLAAKNDPPPKSGATKH